MLVVTRYTVPVSGGADFLAKARTALGVLEARPGWRSSRVALAHVEPSEYEVLEARGPGAEGWAGPSGRADGDGEDGGDDGGRR